MGRPVLIGAHSIEESDAISQLLQRDGIQHNLLNAANDLEEDRIIQEAGLFGAVTVATDMAGRGTDIILETGSDRRIAESYAILVGELLADGAGVVTLTTAPVSHATAGHARGTAPPAIVPVEGRGLGCFPNRRG